MTRHALIIVARWEYHRFAKPRDLVLSTVFIIVVFGVFAFVSRLIESKSNQPLNVAVVGAEHMGLDAVESLQRFHLVVEAERGLPELEGALEELNSKVDQQTSARDELSAQTQSLTEQRNALKAEIEGAGGSAELK